MSRVLGLVAVVFVFVFVFVSLSRSARGDGGPAPVLAGTWESQLRDNAFVLRIAWVDSNRRYEGVLVRNSPASERAGFRPGEVTLIATPGPNPRVMPMQVAYRRPGRLSWAGG